MKVILNPELELGFEARDDSLTVAIGASTFRISAGCNAQANRP
jgi:hypothetical protein